MPTVSLDSVLTEDAHPDQAPFRISALPDWDTATVKFTPTTADDGAIGAWRVTFDGNRKDGLRLASRGVVCGLDRCGRPDALLLGEPSGQQHEVVISYDQLPPPPDGSYPVEVTAASDVEGWA